MLSGDVETNLGPLSNCKEYFPICHWNLNSISAPDYSNLFLLKAYIMLHKFDIICSSETYLNSTTPSDDDKLQIPGYTFIRCDLHNSLQIDSKPHRSLLKCFLSNENIPLIPTLFHENKWVTNDFQNSVP